MLNEAKDEQEVDSELFYKSTKTPTKINSGLIIPELMPDEFLAGYAGRICKLNDFNDSDALRTYYFKRRLSKDPEHSKQQLLAYLAEELDLPEEYLFKHHTVLKFWQSHKSSKEAVLNVYKIWGCILKANQSPHGFCEKCIKEDLNYHGFSYWRTQHQIHGIDFCYKHEKEAIKYRESNDALRYSPSWNLKSNNYQTTNIEEECFSNKFILRYQRIVKEYLEMDFTINVNKVATHLRNLVQTPEWKALRNTEVEILSKYIIENFPNQWLKIHFPIFLKHKVGNIPGLDSLFKSRSIVIDVNLALLAMAALQDDSTLWSYLTHFQTKNQLCSISRENDNELLAAYINNEKSIVKTAIALNLEYDGLRKRLKKIKNRIGIINSNPKLTEELLNQVPNRNYTKRQINA